jgi:hypothetical protein
MFLQLLQQLAPNVAVVLIAVAVVFVVVAVVDIVVVVAVVNIVVFVDMDNPLHLLPAALGPERPDSMLQLPFVLLLYKMVDNCRRIVLVADIGFELVVHIETVLAVLAGPGIDHNHCILHSTRYDIKILIR